MKSKFFLIFIFITQFSNAQTLTGPTETFTGNYLGKTIPLRDFPTVETNQEKKPREITIVPNDLRRNKKTNSNAFPLYGDQLAQRRQGGITGFALDQNFEGASSAESFAIPPDPTGAAGPSHYVHAVNSIVKIFDKAGTLLTGPTALGDFLGNGDSLGDPIVLYDQLADRYFISQFGTFQNLSLVIGVSETNDPTGAYNVYEFEFDSFPDYPKYSVWHNAYFLTANKAGANKVYAIEREAVINADENPQILGFSLQGLAQNPISVLSPLPANLLGTTVSEDVPGYITYLQDDGWFDSITFDHLKVWEIDLDWDNVSNSTISDPLEIPTDPFDSVFAPFGTGDVEQPGTSQKIDMIGGVISFAANYRSFDTHNSWVITFNTDVDGNDTSGVRWVELRNDSTNPWSVFQEGTYAPSDGNSRFMGSAAMDAEGNIALGFNVASGSLPVGIRYTGRFYDDPLDEMTIAETTIVDGAGVQTNTNRFGDYSHLTLDPDGFRFWHTAQYFQSDDFWSTRISSFRLSGDFTKDIGISAIPNPSNGNLSSTESVEVTIRNYGSESQSNFPIELRLDGSLVATENFTGTIDAGETANYTFTPTVDLSNSEQTYDLEANTLLTGDEFPDNDLFSKDVTNLLSNDLGVTQITSPNSNVISSNQDVTIIIKNFGASLQSTFDVQYSLNSESPVIETVNIPVDSEEQITYTFNTPIDLNTPGNYVLEAKTNLTTDGNTTNDVTTLDITSACLPEALNGCLVDGIKRFVLNTIDVDDGGNGCNTEPGSSPQGYADRTNLSTTLLNVESQNVYTLQAQQNWGGGSGVEALSVWVDFNDNSIFEASEQLIAGEFFQEVEVLEDFTLTIPVGAALGSHTLRVKAIDTSAGGDINEPCTNFDFGEVQDYTVEITDNLSVEDLSMMDSSLKIISEDNKHFDIILDSEVEGTVYIGVYNVLGQQLKFKSVPKTALGYQVFLNMSYANAGVYFVKMGTQNTSSFLSGKIIVK